MLYFILQISGYVLSLLSIRAVAQSFGLSADIDFFWLLQAYFPLVCLLIYPFREYYISKYVTYSNHEFGICIRFGKLIGSLFLVYIIAVFLYYISSFLFIQDELTVYAYKYSIPTLICSAGFLCFEFFSSVALSLNRQLSSPAFKCLNSALLLLSSWVFPANLFALLYLSALGYFLFCIYVIFFIIKGKRSNLQNDSSALGIFTQHFVSNILSNICNFIFRYFLASSGVGILSAFQYAFSILSVAVSFIVVPFSNVSWPIFIRKKGDFEFTNAFVNFIFWLFYVLIFGSIILSSISDFIFSVVFFGLDLPSDLFEMTREYFKLIVFSLPFMFVLNVLIRFFSVNSYKNGVLVSSAAYSFVLGISSLLFYIEFSSYTFVSFLLANITCGAVYLFLISIFVKSDIYLSVLKILIGSLIITFYLFFDNLSFNLLLILVLLCFIYQFREYIYENILFFRDIYLKKL